MRQIIESLLRIQKKYAQVFVFGEIVLLIWWCLHARENLIEHSYVSIRLAVRYETQLIFAYKLF